jgi:hypothetical protein
MPVDADVAAPLASDLEAIVGLWQTDSSMADGTPCVIRCTLGPLPVNNFIMRITLAEGTSLPARSGTHSYLNGRLDYAYSDLSGYSAEVLDWRGSNQLASALIGSLDRPGLNHQATFSRARRRQPVPLVLTSKTHERAVNGQSHFAAALLVHPYTYVYDRGFPCVNATPGSV